MPRLSDKLQFLGFSPSKADVSLFHYKKGAVTMFLLVYVDDIILVSSSSLAVPDLLSSLKQNFALKDLSPLHYFLGIEVQRSSDDLWLSQKKYTNDLLQRAGMPSCKLVSTHHATSTKLSTHEGDLLISEDAKY
jgi:hypothetical protein